MLKKIFINMSCTQRHRLNHLKAKKKLLDKKKGMLPFPYEAFVDEKTNLRTMLSSRPTNHD
jgi:hypothetical protein